MTVLSNLHMLSHLHVKTMSAASEVVLQHQWAIMQTSKRNSHRLIIDDFANGRCLQLLLVRPSCPLQMLRQLLPKPKQTPRQLLLQLLTQLLLWLLFLFSLAHC